MTQKVSRRFSLLNGDSKNLRVCPKCEKKRFRPYFDEKEERVLEEFGVCNRVDSCGFSRFPFELIEEDKKGQSFGGKRLPAPSIQKPKKIRRQTEFIDFVHFYRLEGRTPLEDFFQQRFGKDALLEVLRRFPTGAAVYKNRTYSVHWHIDEDGNIHTGKMMQYDLRRNEVGKLCLKRTGFLNWVHAVLEPPLKSGEWTQTLFGLLQLKERPEAPVAVCEGYRVAMTASLYFPKYVWTAVDSCAMLTAYDKSCSVLEPLKGRQIILFPDLGRGAEDWRKGAKVLRSQGFDVSIDSTLEEIATKEEREKGLDLEDFLLRFEPEDFQ